MKAITKNLFRSLSIVCGLITLASFVQAQTLAGTVPPFTNSLDIMTILNQARALAASEPVLELSVPVRATGPTAELPTGTYWSLTDDQPPMPFDPFPSLPVYTIDSANGIFLLDDRSVDWLGLQAQQVEQSQAKTMAGTMMAMDVPSPGDGGDNGTNSFTPDYSSYTVDYGSNLWVAGISVLSGNLNGTATNTQNGVMYDIESRTNLTQTDWQYEGTILGSDATNWTPLSVAQNGRPILFLRLRSNADDGSGLPYWWEEQYGLLGVDPNALDSAGDGWTVWQKFKMGLNPNTFFTPPAPQGVTVNYNSHTGAAGINWQLSPGPATGYTVEKDVNNWAAGQTAQYFNVSGANTYSDTVSPATLGPYDGGGNIVSYRIQAHYAGGDSSWSDSAPLEPSTITANFTTGPLGSAYVTTSPLPSGTTSLQVTLVDEEAWFWYLIFGVGSEPVNPTFTIPVTNPSLAQYLIPATNAVVPPPSDGGNYFWYVQTETTNGNLGAPYLTTFDTYSLAPPYFDGRAQLKQNLIFLLRAAPVDSPFKYIEINTNDGKYYTFANPLNYVYSGFYQLDETDSNPNPEEYIGSFDAYWPFANNYRYRNFVLNSTNLNSNGRITTGAGGNYYYNYFPAWGFYSGGLMLAAPSAFQFQPPATNGATIPALLATNNTRWLVSYALDSAPSYLWKIGATNYGNAYGLFSGVQNWFGLPILSADIAGTNATTVPNRRV
jgi:hypothetical protein